MNMKSLIFHPIKEILLLITENFVFTLKRIFSDEYKKLLKQKKPSLLL